MMSRTSGSDRMASSNVYNEVTRRVAKLLLCAAIAACGGSGKTGATTTPTAGSGSNAPQSMQNTATPTGDGVAAGSAATNNGTPDSGGGAGSAAEVPIVFPNQDPDPAQAKAQVDQHLNVARQALAAPTPDPDTAMREAREALRIDAANIDAAAMVAFAYYHKKQYDTAELVLDDVFKREQAKQNANIYYVYGLLYDHTNRPDQAVLAYQKAIGINPSFASAEVNLGVHQLQNKQYTEAQATFEKLTQGGRNDAVTLTSLGSAYRGHSAYYPAGSTERNTLITSSESAYKRALSANPNYSPAYYDLGLLYLDSDPFPGVTDDVQRLNAAKGFFDRYKDTPGFDLKLFDERTKDVTKAIKRAQKKQKKGANP